MDGSTLAALGWTDERAAAFTTYRDDGLAPARVVAQHRAGYAVRGDAFDGLATARGRLYDEQAVPAVGDWVALRAVAADRGVIEGVLPRTTVVKRKTAWSEAEEQVLAANVDTIFVVAGLDLDFDVRRIERYLTMVWDSGAEPVLVLSKLDVCDDPLKIVQAEAVAIGLPVLPLSNVTGDGLDALETFLRPARTVALLGSSGVGKSTIVNRLLGEDRLPTKEVRSDGRGRHTTRHRELYELPRGALLVDTPGIRELQLWDGDLEDAFADVAELATQCRFNDCAHETEPGCAVRDAVEPARLASYRKLQRELEAIARRRDARARRELKQRWRRRTREVRQARRRGML